MIFKNFTIAIFIASLENKRISSLVANDENTVNSAGSRPYDKGGGGHPDPGIMGGVPPGPWPGSATCQTSTTGYLSITVTLFGGQCIY